MMVSLVHLPHVINNKLSCGWQTAQRILASALTWLT